MLWFKQNRLQINVDKSCMMYIGSCQRLNNLNDNNLSKPEIEGQSINVVESCKYLGLFVDSNIHDQNTLIIYVLNFLNTLIIYVLNFLHV